MAIPTTRARDCAEIVIHEEKCTGCGLCVRVCKDFDLVLADGADGKVRPRSDPGFGCFGCGHCMAICPTGAIEIVGRTLSPDDLFALPKREEAADYGRYLALLRRRRSIREFRDQPVEPEMVERILDAARTAPMGLPPSDVHVLVLDSREKTRVFAERFCAHLEKSRWIASEWFLRLMRPFWGKANDDIFRSFVRPLLRIYTENMRRGVDLVTYDAPLAMYFYGSPYCDPADPIVAATCAMYAGEALGLGTCMIGGVHPLIQYGRGGARFRKEQGIRHASREGLFVLFGHADVRYRKGLRRTFASVDRP